MFRFIGKLIKRIFQFICIIVLLTVAVIGYARFIEPQRLNVTEHTDISYAMKEPVTVVVFSDTHFGFDYDLDDFQKVVDKVNENPPDIIIFAGDLIDHLDQYDGDTSLISQKLGEMDAKLGKFAVFGNHDYGGGAEWKYESIMNAGGFTVLKNEIITLEQYNMRIIGIDDLVIGYGDPDIINNADAELYNLVVCHEPDIIDDIQGSNADYMFAGHTHGGQIRLPYYTDMFLPSYGRNYVKGEYQIDNEHKTVLYVTPGLGTTKIPARFGSVPELTYLTITPAQ